MPLVESSGVGKGDNHWGTVLLWPSGSDLSFEISVSLLGGASDGFIDGEGSVLSGTVKEGLSDLLWGWVGLGKLLSLVSLVESSGILEGDDHWSSILLWPVGSDLWSKVSVSLFGGATNSLINGESSVLSSTVEESLSDLRWGNINSLSELLSLVLSGELSGLFPGDGDWLAGSISWPMGSDGSGVLSVSMLSGTLNGFIDLHSLVLSSALKESLMDFISSWLLSELLGVVLIEGSSGLLKSNRLWLTSSISWPVGSDISSILSVSVLSGAGDSLIELKSLVLTSAVVEDLSVLSLGWVHGLGHGLLGDSDGSGRSDKCGEFHSEKVGVLKDF